jgi:hypothetical protein
MDELDAMEGLFPISGGPPQGRTAAGCRSYRLNN